MSSALVAIYVLVGHLGLGFAFYQDRSTMIWAPSGFAVAAVWLFGNRMLWAVFVGAFLTNLIAAPEAALSALIALGNTAEAWLAGWFMRRLDLGAGFRGTRDVLVYFGAVVFAATLIAAVNGTAWLVLLSGMPLAEAPLAGSIWWLGDAGGVLVVTSVIVAFARPSTLSLHVDPGVLLATVVAAGFVAVGPTMRAGADSSVAAAASVLCLVLPYPAVTWAALRMGLRGASAVTALIALAAVVGTAAGAGPFQTGDAHIDVVSLWALLVTLAVSAMLLAASFEARMSATIRQATLEQELLKSRTLGELGLLAGGIAHDFNNILTVVQANAKMLLELDEPMRSECARDIDEATLRGRELTEQLLAYAGGRAPLRRRFDVATLAAETARLLSSHCPPGVDLKLDLAQGTMVDGEPVQLRQVFINLLMNAFDAMRGLRGRIVLSVQKVADHVTIMVTDEGPGMPAEVRMRVFEPFFTTKQQGHGLGLAAVQGIVTAHGGTIVIDTTQGEAGANEGPTQRARPRRISGTSFRVQLPSSPEIPAAAAQYARRE